jgi:hypothetical protein
MRIPKAEYQCEVPRRGAVGKPTPDEFWARLTSGIGGGQLGPLL